MGEGTKSLHGKKPRSSDKLLSVAARHCAQGGGNRGRCTAWRNRKPRCGPLSTCQNHVSWKVRTPT